MVDQLEVGYGRAPAEYLVDGGYVNHTEIERLSAGAMTIYLPVQPARRAGHDPHQPHPGDRPGVIARVRLDGDRAGETDLS